MPYRLLPLAIAVASVLAASSVRAETAPTPTVPPPPPATAPAPDPAEVLKRLGGDDWKQRQAAERDLVRLGDEALPAIDAMLKDGRPDAETRSRLEGARRQIAEDRATGMTYVTLQVKDAAPADALAAFAKASGAPLRPYPDNLFEHGPWPRVTLDLDRAPYWDALRQFCDRVGVTPNGWNDGMRLMRGGEGEGDAQIDGLTAVDGPFLVVANAIHRNRTVRLAKDPAAAQVDVSDFGVQLSVFAEPKLTVLACAESVFIEAATDDHGNSLAPVAPPDEGTYFGGGGGPWTLEAALRYPEKNPGARIARLRGTFAFTIQSASQTIEIDDPLHAAERTTVVNGTTITIRPMTRRDGPGKNGGAGYALNVLIAQPLPDAEAPVSVQQTLQTRLRVLDAKGNALTSRSLGGGRSDGRSEHRLFYTAGRNDDGEPAGEPAKLVWEIPTETKQRKVTFEFKDLPMP